MRDKILRGKQEGTVLLLALLVMSGVLITAASLGTIAVLSFRQGRLVDDSINAFSSAESGAEQTLYQIRRLGTSVATLNTNGADTSSTTWSGPSMGSNGAWTRTLTNSETSITTDLPQDKSYELTLWNPDAPTTPAGIESLKFTWTDQCGGTSGIEVLSVGWDPTTGGTSPFIANVTFDGNSPALTYLYSSSGVIDNTYTAARAYRVRLRAKNCNIYSLNIAGWSADNAGGSLVNLPSRVAVTSTGSFGSARQAMSLRLPRLQPLSGVFDYVIFSQCSILKGVTGPACP